MPEKEPTSRPDGKFLGLPAYLVWLGHQITATAVSAYSTIGVGFLEARVLFVIGRHSDLHAAAMVQHLGVDRAAISRALAQLKGAGLVLVDERRRFSLSEAGWAMRKEIVQISDERLDRFTAGFEEAELAQLLSLLLRLHQNVPELAALSTRLALGGRKRRPGRAAIRRASLHRTEPAADSAES